MPHASLKCAIVDDDPIAISSLQHLIAKVPNLQLEKSFEQPIEALHYFQEHAIDLLFLDVEMPDLTGIELVKTLQEIPYIIMISAKKEYAFDAFEMNVVDYLQKPVGLSRFMQAINKIQPAKTKVAEQAPTYFFVRADGELRKIAFDQVIYIESLTDYVRIHTVQGNHVVHSSIKSMEEQMPEKDFLKVHRSYIVNLQHVVKIDEGLIICQGTDTVIPVSRANKNTLLNRLNLLQ